MAASPSSRLVVFVKAARLGFVKTRLAEKIGPEAACNVYRELVAAVLNRIDAIPSVELRFTPDNAQDEIRPWSQPGWELAAQGAGDLGEKLRRAFDEQFASGAERVVIIGSDCPEILENDIVEAWDALANRDVVLGPAMDGGYWLIGLRSQHPELFEGIAWSSPVVLEETMTRILKAGLSIHLLRKLSDVDTVEDFQAWCDHRSKSKQSSAHFGGLA